MRLFRVKENKLELVNEGLLTIQEFSKIINFPPSGITSTQVFIFIYHYCDYTSPYSGYVDSERYVKALYEAGIKSDFRLDGMISDAIKKYLQLRDTPTIKTLKAVNKALDTTSELLNGTVERLDKNLKILNKTDVDSLTEPKDVETYNKRFDTVKSDLSYLLKLIPDIEKNVKTADDLLVKAIKDDYNNDKAKGDKVIGNRAEPKRHD